MIKYKELSNGMFELLEDYSEDTIAIAKGFTWDGASIPWWLRWLIEPTRRTKEGSMVHDLLYASGNGVSRKAADYKLFKELVEDDVQPIKAFSMWLGVRLFGWIFFQGE
jgi:hypothetical protein